MQQHCNLSCTQMQQHCNLQLHMHVYTQYSKTHTLLLHWQHVSVL